MPPFNRRMPLIGNLASIARPLGPRTEETPLIIRRFIVPLTAAGFIFHAGQAFAQVVFPAPLPDQAAPAMLPSTADACTSGFALLREEAEARGKMIKAASERHAQPDEACRLIGSFSQSEIKMIKYLEANSARCGFSLQISYQLRAGHKASEAMQKKVCAVAQGREPAGPVGDFQPYYGVR